MADSQRLLVLPLGPIVTRTLVSPEMLIWFSAGLAIVSTYVEMQIHLYCCCLCRCRSKEGVWLVLLLVVA